MAQQHKAFKRTKAEHERNLPASGLSALPHILVSLETLNDAANIFPFFQSLGIQSYPAELLSIAIVDRGSSDDTLDRLEKAKTFFGASIRSFHVTSMPGATIGAAHNANFREAGDNPFVLVCSPSVIVQPDALNAVVGLSKMSSDSVAAWELRQTPSESSKLYSPSNLETSWASARCTLFRTRSVLDVGGFEEKALHAGEDVELSYRLRDSGYRLLYAPQATFWSNDDAEEAPDLPAASIEAQLSNIFIRMRYGSLRQRAVIPLLLAKMWKQSVKTKKDRELFTHAVQRLVSFGPRFLMSKRASSRIFPICGWNYEFLRAGSNPGTKRQLGMDITHPLVSIIIRKHRNHSGYLLECIRSIANQTYPNLEVLVIDTQATGKQDAVLLNRVFGPDIPIKFAIDENGNAATAANAGIKRAKGEHVVILNDDNLLFADHIENLMAQVDRDKTPVAYSYALETLIELRSKDPFLYLEQTTSHRSHKSISRTDLWRNDCIPLSCVLLHKSALTEKNPFDPDLSSAADWDVLTRLSLTHEFKCVTRSTVLCRKARPDATTAEQKKLHESFVSRARTKQRSYRITLSPEDILNLQLGAANPNTPRTY